MQSLPLLVVKLEGTVLMGSWCRKRIPHTSICGERASWSEPNCQLGDLNARSRFVCLCVVKHASVLYAHNRRDTTTVVNVIITTLVISSPD